MSDMGDDFRELQKEKQDRHARWKFSNTSIIKGSLIKFEERNDGEMLMFRNPGKPKVDFYPSTGRWLAYPDKGRVFRGGANAFLAWYAKQGPNGNG